MRTRAWKDPFKSVGFACMLKPLGGWPRGRVVEFACSALAALGFAGLDPECRHGTVHQAMLKWHPT
ncbi:hypothetical protein AWN78_19575 [Clostridioides difficile]|nr:hypothetical protein AWN78_19575 [Clostridioides difficile]